MNKPAISIIMSSYNDSFYIKEAIESVLQQSFTDWEFIIINDASTDNTAQIIHGYANKDKRIIVIQNIENKGQTESLIIGFNRANGEYIARIDGDDEWVDKNKLLKQVNFFKNNPEYGLVGSWAYIVDKKGNRTTFGRSPVEDEDIRNYMLIENCFFHSSVIIKKSVIEKVGYYNQKIKYSQDYELWLRIGLSCKMYNIEEYLINYRMNPNGISSTNYNLQLRETFDMVRKFRNYYPHYKKAILLWYLRKYIPKKIKTIISNRLKNRYIARKVKQLFINLE